jgi:hypothetical protein
MSTSSTVVSLVEVEEEDLAIEVRDNNGFKGVFATQDIAEDSIIFLLRGTISTEPTMYTIQLGRNRHLNFPVVRKKDDDLDYCWQFLNHCCEPNGYMDVVGLTFRASRNIRRGEEITFNYLTTESAMAVPFECLCGSDNCFGYIQGRDFVTPHQLVAIVETVPTAPLTTPLPLIQRATGNLRNSFSSSMG